MMQNMFTSMEQDDPILRPTNRWLKRLEKVKWKMMALIGLLIFLLLLAMPRPTETANYGSELEEQLSLFIVIILLVYVIFLFFFWGFKAGLGVYKPQDSYLTLKEHRNIDKEYGTLKDGESFEIKRNLKKSKKKESD